MTFLTYADLSSATNATTDATELLVYVNNITDGMAMPMVLFAFFIVAFISSGTFSLKTKGFWQWHFSFAAAGFATFGLAVLMSLKNGLLEPTYLLISLGVAILGVVILYMASE